jgi:peptidoglycan hydrolase-like protein with peptidoglycan-binding domain
MARSDLSAAQVEEVQKRLHAAGHYQGRIDGLIGPQTIAAIRDFQTENQLPVTGTLTPETANALGVGYEPIGDGFVEPVAGSDRQPNEIESTAGRSNAQQPVSDTGSIALSSMDEASVRALQEKLQGLGYYRASIDGIAGPMTRAALTRFYNEQARLAASGRLPPSAAEMLGIDVTLSEGATGSEGAPGAQGPAGSPPTGSPSPGEAF